MPAGARSAAEGAVQEADHEAYGDFHGSHSAVSPT
jgi:hypothetical protein